MKTLIVDRIEADFAVCEIEEGSFTDIPLKALPNGVKEGDVIKISVEAEETEKRKSRGRETAIHARQIGGADSGWARGNYYWQPTSRR